ncbi:MAG: hypothetical protein HS111_06855 [Kofleriaceae bacterium]|nr:hypothetical protein [Kofleriaceae bacterium]MCL4225583.1 hypothetical protein [Myxococcales bacterium]
MSTPTYKGPGQPAPLAIDGVTGWLGGFLGGTPTPVYKTAPPVPPPAPGPCPPCPPCPSCPVPKKPEPTKQQPPCPAPLPPAQHDPCGDVPEQQLVLGDCGDTVIPVGNGPITIVVEPRPHCG